MPPKKVEVVEEPIEAQPPAGIVFEEPVLTEASDEEMAALRAAAFAVAPIVEEDVSVEVVVESSPSAVKFGDFVSFVLDRDTIQRLEAMKVSTTTLCSTDVVLGLVISEDNGEGVNLRLFVDADAVPVVRHVKGFKRPEEVTRDHCGMYFV
jgi:hypothetical protein